MEILVRFITCCGINMRTYLRTYLWLEMPNGKMKKKQGRFCLFLFLPLYMYHIEYIYFLDKCKNNNPLFFLYQEMMSQKTLNWFLLVRTSSQLFVPFNCGYYKAFRITLILMWMGEGGERRIYLITPPTPTLPVPGVEFFYVHKAQILFLK